MGVFIALYILLFSLWSIKTAGCNNHNKAIVWLLGFLFIYLVLALRADSIGNDLKAYIPLFDTINSNYLSDVMEQGYILLNSIVHYFTTDHNIFLSIVAFISFFPISLLIKKYSPDIVFSYIIYVSFIIYHFSFSGLRQAAALGIIGISYIFLNKRKVWLFIGSVILAATFHVSAIVFIIAYPLCNWLRMSTGKYIIASVLGIIVILSLSSILAYIVPLVFGGEKYMGYIKHEVIPSYNLLIAVFFIFLFTFLAKKPSEFLRNSRALLFMAVMCQSLGLVSVIGTRIAYYFFIAVCLAIPQTITEWQIGNLTKQITKFSIASAMCAFFFYANSSGYLEVIPYRFFWE